jgi:exonuclease III
MKILSYNIWFSTHNEHARLLSLVNTLVSHNSDIIMLQEVKPHVLFLLQTQLSKKYPNCYPEQLKDHYGCVIFSKHKFNFQNIIQLESNMYRHLVLASVIVNNTEILVATTHFESEFGKYNTIKKIQYRLVTNILDDLSSQYSDIFFAGDCNILPFEESNLFNLPNWSDAWATIGNDTNKFTYDSTKNYYLKNIIQHKRIRRNRLDRIYYYTNNYKITNFQLISNQFGYDEPSDHFGICASFS